MKIAKSAWKLMIVLLLLSSLTLNVAMFVGGSIYKMASSAFSAATGVRSVAIQHADEIVELGGSLADERKVSRKLRGEVVEISDNLVSERKASKTLRGKVTDLTGDLAAKKALQRKLKNQVTDLSGDLVAERLASKKARDKLTNAGANMVTYRGKKMARNQAVELTTGRISKRAIKTSSRSIGSMAGEALPYLGTAVIIGVTTLELKDLCDTIKDMNELKRSFNPELQNTGDQKTVCSIKVPTAGELWETAKGSPELAWKKAKEVTPTLKEIQGYEFPEIEWADTWNSTEKGVEGAWSKTKDGAGKALDKTTAITRGLTEYWLGDSDDEKIEE